MLREGQSTPRGRPAAWGFLPRMTVQSPVMVLAPTLHSEKTGRLHSKPQGAGPRMCQISPSKNLLQAVRPGSPAARGAPQHNIPQPLPSRGMQPPCSHHAPLNPVRTLHNTPPPWQLGGRGERRVGRDGVGGRERAGAWGPQVPCAGAQRTATIMKKRKDPTSTQDTRTRANKSAHAPCSESRAPVGRPAAAGGLHASTGDLHTAAGGIHAAAGASTRPLRRGSKGG
jgi:hypothetical protein